MTARAHAPVVIVGGGPAGLTTAIAAVRHAPSLAGNVVVLERATYPREKICAGAIGARGDLMLERLGVRVDVPSVVIDEVRTAFARGDSRVREPALGRVVRRRDFDAALAAAARERGVRIVEGASVTSIDRTRTGASVVTSAGAFEASCIVGADGVGSTVRRTLGLPFGRLRAQVVEVDTEPTPRDAPRDALAFDVRDPALPGYTWDFPTLVDGRALVCRGAYVLHVGGGAAIDPSDVLRAHLAARGLDLRSYRQKRFAERAYEPGLPIAKPRVLLVGEAAGIEPLLGEGIAHAILYGALAGRYLAERVPASRFAFRSYAARVALAPRVGLDVAIRTGIARAFYGAGRAPLEAGILEAPAFLAAGARYFAGRPFVRALAGALPAMALSIAAATTSASRADGRAPSSTRR